MEEFQLELDEEGMISTISCVIDSSGVRFPKLDMMLSKDGISNISTGNKVQNIQNCISAQDIEVGEIIGQGASSFVSKGVYKPYNYPIGIKTVNVYDKDKRHQMLNDFKVLLTQYTHPNLINCFGAYYEEGTIKIILELMDLGSIRNLIDMLKEMYGEGPIMNEQILAIIVIQLLKGLEFLHKERHQVHRDIKPENILINKSGHVKLTDFGISKQLEKTQQLCMTYVGTTLYMSPERLIGNQYGLRSDIWSVGLVIIELATGLYPYDIKNKSIVQFVSSILQSKEPTLPDNGKYSASLMDFVKKCVAKEQKDRLDISDLLKHEWITQYNMTDEEQIHILQQYLQHLELSYYQFKHSQQQQADAQQ